MKVLNTGRGILVSRVRVGIRTGLATVLTQVERGVYNVASPQQQTKEWCRRPGGVLPYMGYIGMCRCERQGFQTVYSRIRYINQSVWV